MARPVTLMSIQWSDLSLEEMCKLGAEMGYEGLELAPGAHVDIEKAAEDPAYCEEVLATLDKYGLKTYAMCLHLPGQCVGDLYDSRLDGFAPAECAGNPEAIRKFGFPLFFQVNPSCIPAMTASIRLPPDSPVGWMQPCRQGLLLGKPPAAEGPSGAGMLLFRPVPPLHPLFCCWSFFTGLKSL